MLLQGLNVRSCLTEEISNSHLPMFTNLHRTAVNNLNTSVILRSIRPNHLCHFIRPM